MVLEELPIGEHEPPGLNIVRLVHASELRDFATVVATAYAETGMPPAAAEATFGDARKLLRPEIDCYVAYEADTPVACSMAITTDHLAGIYWVGTVPAARRRGLGAAVTLAAITGGMRSGASRAFLQATVTGRELYESIGFTSVTEYGSFVISNA